MTVRATGAGTRARDAIRRTGMAGGDEAFDAVLSYARGALSVPMSRLPLAGDSRYGWNGVAHVQDNVVTADGRQYVAWIGEDATPLIAQRLLPDGAWTTFDLSTIAANPLGAIDLDNHNTLNIGVDGDGYIHLAGNQHFDALNYVRSSNPHDITAWTAPGMIGTLETSVTYPRFVTRPDGSLLFFYRDGGSGNGDIVLNSYTLATATWARVGVLMDGRTGKTHPDETENPYLQHVGVDWATGDVHVMFVWRGSGLSAATNNDLCYAMLDASDGTWKRSDGTAYTLPITHETAEIVLDTDPTDSGLVNQCGMEVDSLGRPHAANFLYDGAGKVQMHHVWFDGTDWHNDQVTAWTSTRWIPTSRPSVFTYGERTFIAYRENSDDAHPTEYRCMEVGASGVVADFVLFDRAVQKLELTFDTRALKERGELVSLVTAVERNGVDSELWGSVPVDVMTVDLATIDDFIEGHRALVWTP